MLPPPPSRRSHASGPPLGPCIFLPFDGGGGDDAYLLVKAMDKLLDYRPRHKKTLMTPLNKAMREKTDNLESAIARYLALEKQGCGIKVRASRAAVHDVVLDSTFLI